MSTPQKRRGFNLSEWALRHRSMVWYFLIVSMIAGTFAYLNLGREEDPNFTIKTMVIAGALPGASVEETLLQVTDRIEKKLEDLDELDTTRSVTMQGQSVVYVDLLETTNASEIDRIWQDVRNMMADIRGDFPEEFTGFQFNDNFGDVFGNIYAFTADGYSPREMRDRLEEVRTTVQNVPQSGKVELLGVQDEVIYIHFSPSRLAALGLTQSEVMGTLQEQNALVPSGVIDSGEDRAFLRVTGAFAGVKSLEDVNLRIGERFYSLSDLGSIERSYEDPPSALFRYDGRPAYGLSIGMVEGGNILQFGEDLDAAMAEVAADLPVGIEMYRVANQPEVVDYAVGHFVQALAEAVIIVLIVSFVSLGMRAGLVVTMTIPLVLAITFVILNYYGINLQRISLGALIIALGLLVDDAMIAIETMISRLERGENKEQAASYAWTSIAFPMLSGTLVTVVGFIPIGLNNSAAGEFTFSLFVVIAVSLIISWIVAVLFAPLLGVTFLSSKMAKHDHTPGWLRRRFHGLLRAAMRFRWITVAVTFALFFVAVWGTRFIENQFFPTSDRPEVIIDVALRQNASIDATKATMDRLESHLEGDEDALFWTSYVGAGAPRFILSYDVPTAGPHMGQIVIQTPSVEARNRLKARLDTIVRADFPAADIIIKNLEIGPPVGKPIQYRVASHDLEALLPAARGLAAEIASDTRLADITLDWSEPARVVKVDVLYDRARQLGLSPQGISQLLNSVFVGQTITQIRDDTYLIDVIARGQDTDRQSIDALRNLQISTPGGMVPLRAFATLSYDVEHPIIRQEGRIPTITVKAAISAAVQPDTIVADLASTVAAYQDSLPAGITIEVGGTVESSAESQGPIAAVVPLMLFLMVTLVMVQMQSFRLTAIVISVAPLALIGVVLALGLSGAPLGFVAILGVLSLIGILIRNSLILIHEVQVLYEKGRSRWDAVFEASDSRARPILLTAAAASLALIPISRQIFWGPMAFAMMGGIIVGTLITLIFVPALYCVVFRVKRPDERAYGR
ncbi:efflux RND transporter permease subunit [Paracoccaceae bacterium GXU_MW_L88]